MRCPVMTDGFIVFSSHSNSNQSYEMVTPLFLRGGKFHGITSLFVYGERVCSYDRRQEASYATRADKGSEYNAFVVTFTIETKLKRRTSPARAVRSIGWTGTGGLAAQ
jgi:hypothetical protein